VRRDSGCGVCVICLRCGRGGGCTVTIIGTLRRVAGGIVSGGSIANCNRRSRSDRGIEDVLVVCLRDDGWLDLDETLGFELLKFEYLLVIVLGLGIVPFDLFITPMIRRAGVI